MHHLLYYYHTMVYSYATLERIPRYGHGNLGGGRGIFQSGLTLMTNCKMGHFPHPPVRRPMFGSRIIPVVDIVTYLSKSNGYLYRRYYSSLGMRDACMLRRQATLIKLFASRGEKSIKRTGERHFSAIAESCVDPRVSLIPHQKWSEHLCCIDA
jgi:hypothetical protein